MVHKFTTRQIGTLLVSAMLGLVFVSGCTDAESVGNGAKLRTVTVQLN